MESQRKPWNGEVRGDVDAPACNEAEACGRECDGVIVISGVSLSGGCTREQGVHIPTELSAATWLAEGGEFRHRLLCIRGMQRGVCACVGDGIPIRWQKVRS